MANKPRENKSVIRVLTSDGVEEVFLSSFIAAAWVRKRSGESCTNTSVDGAIRNSQLYGIENSKGFIRNGVNYRFDRIDGSEIAYGKLIDNFMI